MNHLTTFLAFSPPPAQQGAPQGGSGAMMFQLFFFAAIFLIFYLLIWRPNSQRQKKHREMIAALKRGDKIVTNGGLIATVKDVKEDRLVCTVGENTRVEIVKGAVSTVLEKGK